MKTPLLILSASLMLSGAASGQQRSVEDRLNDLEKRVSAMEKGGPLSLFKPPPSPTPAVETKSPLELISWDFKFHRGEYSQYFYTITATLKNNADKDIKLIEASIHFSDLLGNQVYGIKVSPDRLIPAGKAVTDKGDYSVNQFMAEQARMAQMKKEDIKATLVVEKLVFADNSIGEYSP